jgi:hypothetical protein
MQMTAVGYILDVEEIIKAHWSLVQHEAAAAFQLSKSSPLPPALSPKFIPGGQTQKFNVRKVQRFKRYPVDSDKCCSPASISDTENWLHWNGDWDNQNDSDDDRAGDDESDIELNNCIEDSECPEWPDLHDGPNVPGLVRSILKSK